MPRSTLDHALVYKFLKRFFRIYISKVKKKLVPESGIQQMKYGMFRTTNIKVDW